MRSCIFILIIILILYQISNQGLWFRFPHIQRPNICNPKYQEVLLLIKSFNVSINPSIFLRASTQLLNEPDLVKQLYQKIGSYLNLKLPIFTLFLATSLKGLLPSLCCPNIINNCCSLNLYEPLVMEYSSCFLDPSQTALNDLAKAL